MSSEIWKDIKGLEGKYISEEWRDVLGYEGIYQVSCIGRVRMIEVKYPKLTDRNGYRSVSLKGKTFSVHRLVAEAFIHKDNDNLVVNHKDLNRANNCVENLEWITQGENVRHARRLGAYTSKMRNRSKRFVCKTDNKTWLIQREAERHYCLSKGSISQFFNKKLKSVKGYVFERIDPPLDTD